MKHLYTYSLIFFSHLLTKTSSLFLVIFQSYISKNSFHPLSIHTVLIRSSVSWKEEIIRLTILDSVACWQVVSLHAMACPLYNFCLCLCAELEAREAVIKQRTGTSKGLEAQTQHPCWQSNCQARGGDRARERESKNKNSQERRKKMRTVWEHEWEKRGNQRKEGGPRLRQSTHTLLLSPQSGLGMQVAACGRMRSTVCRVKHYAGTWEMSVWCRDFPLFLLNRTHAGCALVSTGN